jgi:type I restriction enzyme R subunit
MTDDEFASYEALEVNDSAVKVLSDDTLKTIARELVDTVRRTRRWTGPSGRTSGHTCRFW